PRFSFDRRRSPMAVLNLESLVLRGVPVACDVVTGLERIGFNASGSGARAVLLSLTRHPSPSDPQAGADPGMRYAAVQGMAHAAPRAGRPGRSAGVPDSRGPAISAGRAILSGWSLAVGDPCATAARRLAAFAGTTPATVGKALTGQPQTSLRTRSQAAGRRLARSGKRAEVEAGSSEPAFGVPSAPLRGKRASLLIAD